MTDIWFLFGALTTNPDLLKVIAENNASFHRIGQVTQEFDPPAGANLRVSWLCNPAAGYLDQTIDGFRVALRDQIASRCSGAPIISLYAAAKLCQLWHTSQDALCRSIHEFNNIFQLAAKAANLQSAPSARLLTLLGACMVDANLSGNLQILGYEYADPGKAVACEFGFSQSLGADPEWNTVKSFVQNPQLMAAGGPQQQFLGVPSWTVSCHEYLFFYEHFKRAAN